MKVTSEFSLADSTGSGKKNTGSRGRYYVRVSLVASLSTPRESRGGNVEFSLVGTPVTCAVQIEILVSLAGIYHDRSAADHWILFRPVYRSALATHGFLLAALECRLRVLSKS